MDGSKSSQACKYICAVHHEMHVFFTTSIFHGQPDLCLNSVTRKYDRYRPFVEVDVFDGYIDKLTSCLPRPYSRPSYLPNHHPKLLVPTSMHLISPDFLLNSSVRNPLLIYIDRLGTFILVRVWWIGQIDNGAVDYIRHAHWESSC